MRAPEDDAPAVAAAFLSSTLAPYGFGDRWAYHDRGASGAVFGMSETELRRLYADAAMIVNLHGGTRPLDEHVRGERLVLVQTDPVRLEIELHDWVPESHAFAGAHVAWFSFAELLGQPGCGLPVPPYPVRPTRQPVLLDMWSTAGESRRRVDDRRELEAGRTGGHLRRPNVRVEQARPLARLRRSSGTDARDVSRPRSVASMRTTPGTSSDRGGRSSTPSRFRATWRRTARSSTVRWPSSRSPRSRTSRCAPAGSATAAPPISRVVGRS